MSVKEKKNNGGFSLVELIVVIAISVVLIGAATISIRSVMGVEVKQCARNIESIINKTRVTTMGKDSAVLEIYKDASDGAYYYKTTINGTVSDPSKIGKNRIDVYYSVNDDYTGKTQLNGSDSIVLQFDRFNKVFSCCKCAAPASTFAPFQNTTILAGPFYIFNGNIS